MFLRLTTPTYFDGLPSTHAEINNLTSGTPAPADGVSVDATYAGTFFVVPGEFATASNVNRSNSALSGNTDFIDDILYTSRPIPTFESFTAGAADTQQAFGGGGDGDVFVGRSGVVVTQEVRNSLVQVVSAATLEPIVQAASGAAIFVNDIRDSGDSGNVIGTEASGYHEGAPIAVFSSALPNGINYRLLHLSRGTVAAESDPADATGDMGFMAQLIIEAARNQEAVNTPFQPGSSNWADSSSLTDFNAQTAIDEIVDTLGAVAGGDDGALHVGAEAHTAAGDGLIDLIEGSLRSQLNGLSDAAAAHALNQNVAGDWTFASGTTLTVSGDAVLGNFVESDADGVVHLGVSATAGTRYLRRFGRVHSSWSHTREDFLGIDDLADIIGIWASSIFGGGTNGIVTDGLDGLMTMVTGATSGHTNAFSMEFRNFATSRGMVCEAILEIDSTADIIVEVGFGTAQTTGNLGVASEDACFVRYDTSLSDTLWTLVGNDDGALTVSTAIAPAAATPTRLTVVCNSDGSAELYVNGANATTIAAGSVGTTQGNMTVKVLVQTDTSAAKTLTLDKSEVWSAPAV